MTVFVVREGIGREPFTSERFIKESEVPFKPCSEFKKADLDARQKLYRKIAE